MLSSLENTAKGVAHCQYLGLAVDGRSEPDPAKWQRGDKTAATVHYEWQHVLRGDQKVSHRVATTVNTAMQRGRLPPSPLDKRAPSNLWFTIEFMQAMAESVFPGTEYAGVSFE